MRGVTAVLLCGGGGERLGGIDKPLRTLAGRPLVERVIERVAPQAESLIISANRNAEIYSRYGYPVVADGAYAGSGPLGGLAAGLAAAVSDDVLCAPGDAPLLPIDLTSRLDDARHAAQSAVAVVDDGSGIQPLCILLPRTLEANLRAFLASGGRAAHLWLESLRPARADFSHWPRWTWSINTPAEWDAAEHHLAAIVAP